MFLFIFSVSVNFPGIFLPDCKTRCQCSSSAVFPYKIRLCGDFSEPGKFAEKTFFGKIEIFLKKRLHFFLSHDNIYKSLVNSAKQTFKNIEAWLSLVERCVRDAEVASSNLVASTHFSLCLKKWPHGQAVKTTPSHGVNSGSIPDEVICFGCKSKAFLLGRFCSAVGSATHS